MPSFTISRSLTPGNSYIFGLLCETIQESQSDVSCPPLASYFDSFCQLDCCCARSSFYSGSSPFPTLSRRRADPVCRCGAALRRPPSAPEGPRAQPRRSTRRRRKPTRQLRSRDAQGPGATRANNSPERRRAQAQPLLPRLPATQGRYRSARRLSARRELQSEPPSPFHTSRLPRLPLTITTPFSLLPPSPFALLLLRGALRDRKSCQSPRYPPQAPPALPRTPPSPSREEPVPHHNARPSCAAPAPAHTARSPRRAPASDGGESPRDPFPRVLAPHWLLNSPNFLSLSSYSSLCSSPILYALAHNVLNPGKDVDVSNLEREAAESELEFLGLLVIENSLKQETKPVLQQRAAARIRSVIVTGDNLQTAVMVARTAGMSHTASKGILVEASEPEGSTPTSIAWRLAEDCEANTAAPHEVYNNTEENITLEKETCSYHFAVNGKSYQVIIKYFYSLLPKIPVNATVFARMSPGQKSSLVEEFQKFDYYVGMCGDGANDCGGQETFSLYVSYTIGNLRVLAIKQLQIFGNQYLIQDAVITLLVCLTMSVTEAYPKLAPYLPPDQLISPPLFSIILNVCFTVIMQTCGFLLVKQQPWYVALASQRHCSPRNQTMSNSSPGRNSTSSGTQSNVLSYEDTMLWPLSSVNCIIVAFVFSKGKPFRKPIYTNYVFSVLLALQLAVCLFLFFTDIDAVYSGTQFLCTPLIWRVYVLLMLLVTFCVFTEDIILQNKHLWLLTKARFGYQSNSQYRKWQRVLQRDPNWPPVNTEDFAAKSTGEIYIDPTSEHSDKD
ncbi:LOW QUALITY PROTEIN: putative cation-transporting ATPase 13A5 [Guaruba guarouba]